MWCKSSIVVFQAADSGASPSAPTKINRSCGAIGRRGRLTTGYCGFESHREHQRLAPLFQQENPSPTPRGWECNSLTGHHAAVAQLGRRLRLRRGVLEVRILSAASSETWGDSAPPVSGTGTGPVRVRGLRPNLPARPPAWGG